MMVVNDATVRTNGHVNTCFFEVIIARFGNFNKCGCLATTDALLLTRDADRTTADANLHEVCARIP